MAECYVERGMIFQKQRDYRYAAAVSYTLILALKDTVVCPLMHAAIM
jgi:hypothetical protein